MSAKKERNVLYKNRFALIFFVWAVLYNVALVNRFVPWEVDDLAIYSFFAVDFSYGFATKLLPGAVFNAIFGSHASRETATAFMTCVILAVFAGAAFLLQKLVLRAPEKRRAAVFFLALAFLSGGYTFAIFTRTIGLLDTWWLVFAILFFLFLDNRILRWLIPLLFAVSIFIHNTAILCIIVLMSVVLLYRASICAEKREKRIYLAIFGVSISAAAALFVFFTMFETKLMVPMEEFHRKLLEHGSDCFYYYDYAFYGIYTGFRYIPDSVDAEPSAIMRLLLSAWYRAKLHYTHVIPYRLTEHLGALAGGLLLTAPPYFMFARFHLARLREKGNGLARFCAFLMIAQYPFTLLCPLPFSEDYTRWFTHAFMISFTLLLTVLYYEKDRAETLLAGLGVFGRSLPARIWLLAYATVSLYTVF